MTTLVIDNYDSFTWNLVQLLGSLGARPVVVRNDAIELDDIRALAPERIVLSPGPGHPSDAKRVGIGVQIIDKLGAHIPILGVCLGHQTIVHAFGGRVVQAAIPMHGKTSFISHDARGIFAGIAQPFEAMRYHSLIAERASLPACLRVTAWCDSGIVMGVEHLELPIFGIQFHPESIGTPCGMQLVSAFIRHVPNQIR